ncbi:unnamed protein product [Prunus armeniaca]|uniref:Late embryogenesis abundant protein LEA-2 subgroup domain-containing protein n=1 Tax=Prunus armeniaca TaxID=36596 RepID=A0A6J5XV35_PRUAR|nr:unnamed protein product [Prunus armeniaca]
MGSGNNLEYNLAANMSVENPNKYSDYRYEKFVAVPSYGDEDLNEVSLSSFEVAKKNTSALTPLVFKGQKSVSLKGDAASNLKSGSVFEIILKIKVKVMSRAGKVEIYNEYKEECKLKVPCWIPREKLLKNLRVQIAKRFGLAYRKHMNGWP